MNATLQADLVYENIKPGIAARVLNSKNDLLRGHLAAQIMELLEQRGVLVFPEIHFNDEQQVAFTSTLGGFVQELRGSDIYKITLDAGQNSSAEYLRGASYWHFDGYMSPMPVRASLLASKVLSPPGTGHTEFCNTYAAYEALPAEEKKAMEKLRVVHSLAASQLFVTPEPTYAKWREWRALGTKELPLVWTHKSGRKSLVIGSAAHYVVGMNPMDSDELLIRLRDLATQPEFHYCHQWKVGDLVMWDNTGTLHRATPYPVDCGRMLHRTKLEGDEPIN